MNKRRYWFVAVATLVFLGAGVIQAQTDKPVQQKPVNIITRSIVLMYADPYQINSTLSPITKANGITVSVDQRNKTLILAGNLEQINEIESLIRRMDTAPVPEKDIEITVYLLTAGDTTGSSQEIPLQLEPVLKQLRSTFTYKSYRLLDTIFIRNRTGADGKTNGSLPPPDAEMQAGSYSLSYNRSYMTRDDKVDVVHLSGLELMVSGYTGRTPGAGGSISTDVDLRTGQMVVVGKTTIGRSALIAVLSAKVVD